MVGFYLELLLILIFHFVWFFFGFLFVLSFARYSIFFCLRSIFSLPIQLIDVGENFIRQILIDLRRLLHIFSLVWYNFWIGNLVTYWPFQCRCLHFQITGVFVLLICRTNSFTRTHWSWSVHSNVSLSPETLDHTHIRRSFTSAIFEHAWKCFVVHRSIFRKHVWRLEIRIRRIPICRKTLATNCFLLKNSCTSSACKCEQTAV